MFLGYKNWYSIWNAIEPVEIHDEDGLNQTDKEITNSFIEYKMNLEQRASKILDCFATQYEEIKRGE